MTKQHNRVWPDLLSSTRIKRPEKRRGKTAADCGKKRRGYGIDRNPLLLLARSERFELPTNGFEVRCSIQLSYERVNLSMD